MIKTPGQMRHRIMIQRPSESVDPSGFDTDEWENVAEVWAAAKDINGWEYVSAAAAQMQNIVTFTVRSRRDIDQTMRVIFRGQPYLIKDIGHGAYRGDYMDLRAQMMFAWNHGEG